MSLGALAKAMLVSAGIVASAYLLVQAAMFLLGGAMMPYEPGRVPRGRARVPAATVDDAPGSETILASGLFGPPREDPPGPGGAGAGPELATAAGLPACQGRLVGIVVNVSNPHGSIAATLGSDGPRMRRIADGDVEKIEPERVLLREGGAICEMRLFAGPAAPVAAIDPERRAAGAVGVTSAVQVSARDARSDDATLEQELRTVRAVARGGGYALFGIRRGTLLDRLGLKNGDVIREVDGHPATDLDAMLRLHAALRAGTLDGVDVVLERRGERHAVRYRLR